MKNYKFLILSLIFFFVFVVLFFAFCRNNPAFLTDDVSDLCKEFYGAGFLHAFFILFGICSVGFLCDQIDNLIKSKKRSRLTEE